MHRKHIDKIIKTGTIAQMIEMKDLFVCAIDTIKKLDEGKYEWFECKLHKILYGHHIGEEIAMEWVSKMANKDGTTGEHWTIEQTSQVMKDKGYHYDAYDWYVVLNMMYSDFYSGKFDTAAYIEMAKDWLGDKDVNNCKLLKYYYYVVC